MSGFNEFLYGPIGSGLTSLLIALAIFVLGFIVAKIIASVVRSLLKKTDLDTRFAEALTEPGKAPAEIENIIAKVVFWIVMLFVLVATFERIGLYGISTPIAGFLDMLASDILPSLGAALLLIFVAWAIATFLRFIVLKGINLLKLDEKFSAYNDEETEEEKEGKVTLGEALSTAVFWFVFLLFLPAVLSTLGISSLADPVQGVFEEILLYLPNIFGAAVVLLIGWFGAKIISKVVSNLLAAVGVDAFGKKAGMEADKSLSKVLGNLTYIFILLLVIVSALDMLKIEAISGPATEMLNTIINIIPALLGAAVVLIAAYYIGKVVSNLVKDLLSNVGFDSLPEKLGMGWKGEKSPSAWIATLTLIMIMFFAATSAAEILGSEFLVEALALFIAFFWKVILAVIIIGIGFYFANVAHKAISAAETANAKLLANLARVTIIIFSLAMGLGELGIAEEIVNQAFGISLAAIGVAVALAFGLGSREVAGREVERFISSMRDEDKK